MLSIITSGISVLSILYGIIMLVMITFSTITLGIIISEIIPLGITKPIIMLGIDGCARHFIYFTGINLAPDISTVPL